MMWNHDELLHRCRKAEGMIYERVYQYESRRRAMQPRKEGGAQWIDRYKCKISGHESSVTLV